jgi:hypothetical protein|uniref:Uncharacterized protein n=1 Tax=Zea mays TaxID=4577 RepID=B4FDA3_MAIZE|nr:unknown [Zea mays]
MVLIASAANFLHENSDLLRLPCTYFQQICHVFSHSFVICLQRPHEFDQYNIMHFLNQVYGLEKKMR